MDRRVTKSRLGLHRALIALMKEKEYSRITVQAILNRALVARSTFYIHFSHKDELLVSGVETLGAELDQRLVATHGSKSDPAGRIMAFCQGLFEHAYEYRDLHRAILGSSAWPIFESHFRAMIEERIRKAMQRDVGRSVRASHAIPADLLVQVISAQLLTTLHWWLSEKKHLRPGEIHGHFSRIATPLIREALA